MTKSDEIRAHAMGVQVPCHDCREMDDLHREHIGRLKADLATCSQMEEFLVRGASMLLKRISHWKLIAFAGWFMAGLMLAGDLMGWGE